MNKRERSLETLLFGNPDKVPFQPGHPRESTLRTWHEQGLPENVQWEAHLRELIGIEPLPAKENVPVWIKSDMIPWFEEKVIEEKEDSLIVQDWKGNVCEISKEYDVTYLRYPKDFVTRRWIRCPVENRDDWEAMKTRYDPEDPSRIPENVEELGKKAENRDYVIGVSFNGPFWQMREWLGFESLCMCFKDRPDFVRDMVAFWKDCVWRLLERLLPYVPIDLVNVSEDMAYKEKAMISPEMAREFLQPCYDQWHDIIEANGCSIYGMDSDGFVEELIPVWIESGFNVNYPMEVAAGNDINELRAIFGKQIAYMGGIDKRAMAKGGRVLRNEMARVEPVVKSGGYIPSCDHGVPPDISWDNFVQYGEILARMTGWK